jgi:hypothetical protein
MKQTKPNFSSKIKNSALTNVQASASGEHEKITRKRVTLNAEKPAQMNGLSLKYKSGNFLLSHT